MYVGRCRNSGRFGGTASALYVARRYGSVKQYIGCDAHFAIFRILTGPKKGRVGTPVRVAREAGSARLSGTVWKKAHQVAVEAVAAEYWFMDELEAAGLDGGWWNPLAASTRTRPTRRRVSATPANSLAITQCSHADDKGISIDTSPLCVASPSKGRLVYRSG